MKGTTDRLILIIRKSSSFLVLSDIIFEITLSKFMRLFHLIALHASSFTVYMLIGGNWCRKVSIIMQNKGKMGILKIRLVHYLRGTRAI